MTTATQTGVVDGKEAANTQEGGFQGGKLSRAAALEQINKTRLKDFEEESGVQIAVTPELTGAETDEETDGDAKLAADIEAKKQAGATEADAGKPGGDELDKQLAADDRVTVIDDPSKFQVKMKIDGVEKTVSLSEVIRNEQKTGAADKRLAEATELLKAAQAQSAAAAEELKKAKATGNTEAVAEAEKSAGDLKAQIQESMEALYGGRTEEAAEMLAKIMGTEGREKSATQPVLDIRQVSAAVRQEIEAESALNQFAKDYPECVENEVLGTMADKFFDTAIAEGKNLKDAFTFAGEEVRKQITAFATAQGMTQGKPSETTRRKALEERKQTLDEPRGTSTAQALQVQSPEEPDRRSVIAEMARNRPNIKMADMAARKAAGG
jgi:hypothetical protein